MAIKRFACPDCGATTGLTVTVTVEAEVTNTDNGPVVRAPADGAEPDWNYTSLMSCSACGGCSMALSFLVEED